MQELPEGYKEQLVAFQRHVIRLQKNVDFQLNQIGNADQTPVYHDMASAFTVQEKGSKQVYARLTDNEKKWVTVCLSSTSHVRELSPYVVFNSCYHAYANQLPVIDSSYH